MNKDTLKWFRYIEIKKRQKKKENNGNIEIIWQFLVLFGIYRMLRSDLVYIVLGIKTVVNGIISVSNMEIIFHLELN